MTYKDIQELYKSKDYKFFTQPWALNLWGQRNGYETVNEWNDILGITFVDEFGTQNTIMSEGTTKPGLYWLRNKMGNVDGTFILMGGQFMNCFEVRKHRGEYEALCQKHGYKGFWGPRDNDKDGEFDIDGEMVNDVTGLNMHHGKDKKLVGPYSAACQVRKHNEDHEILMAIVKKAMDYWKSKYFSYTLFVD